MAIKVIYKVEGDNNSYASEQQAQVAEAIQKLPVSYISPGEKQEIAEAITAKYLLVPIVETEHLVKVNCVDDLQGRN